MKQVTTAEGKAQSEKRSLTGRQIAWMIHHFFNFRGDNEAFLDLRDLSKVQSKNDSVQAFDTKWDDVSSAVIDGPTDSILDSLHKMQIEKSKGFQVYAQETTIGEMKYDCC